MITRLKAHRIYIFCHMKQNFKYFQLISFPYARLYHILQNLWMHTRWKNIFWLVRKTLNLIQFLNYKFIWLSCSLFLDKDVTAKIWFGKMKTTNFTLNFVSNIFKNFLFKVYFSQTFFTSITDTCDYLCCKKTSVMSTISNSFKSPDLHWLSLQ